SQASPDRSLANRRPRAPSMWRRCRLAAVRDAQGSVPEASTLWRSVRKKGERTMLSRFRRLPSPALVIASIALIVAVGGGSFALAISDKKSDKRIAKRVAIKQIRRLEHSLQVKHARIARRAKTGDN